MGGISNTEACNWQDLWGPLFSEITWYFFFADPLQLYFVSLDVLFSSLANFTILLDHIFNGTNLMKHFRSIKSDSNDLNLFLMITFSDHPIIVHCSLFNPPSFGPSAFANPFYGGYGGYGGGGQVIGPFLMPIPYFNAATKGSAEILIPSLALGLFLILRR